MNASGNTGSAEPKKSSTIKYINPIFPSVTVPPYSGQRYEAVVPDTLDLQEVAQLAINGLTSPTDPDADYEIYWRAIFNTNPPIMKHEESDVVQVKHMEALPLMRILCGSRLNLHVEQRWMEVMRQMQGPDGLFYIPKPGRPWCVFGEYGAEPPGDHYGSTWMTGRLIGAMTIYGLLTGEPEWTQACRRAVDGLNKLANHSGGKAHFTWSEYGEEGRFNPPADRADGILNPAMSLSWAIQGLASFHRHSGYQPALQLAEELARWVMEDSRHFGPDGKFLEEYPGRKYAHFHAHTAGLQALLEYGIIAGESNAVEFARRGFEYGAAQGDCVTTRTGPPRHFNYYCAEESLLGFFPEWLYLPRPQTLELCELAEMIIVAVRLSAHGVGDYWDLADRWIRNLFVEGQLTRADRVYAQAEKSIPSAVPPHATADRAVERNIGSFGGWLTPNDFLPDWLPLDRNKRNAGIMHCCTGNGARALYYIWENSLTCADGRLRVNLLLNRASPWADVESHIPYTGQVDVKVKQKTTLSIRLPQWVKPGEASCAVNDTPRSLSFTGRYAEVGEVRPQDAVTLTFSISERTEEIVAEKRFYKAVIKGSTVVSIDPPGVSCPLFQREHYRENLTRWHRVSRFVADKSVAW